MAASHRDPSTTKPSLTAAPVKVSALQGQSAHGRRRSTNATEEFPVATFRTGGKPRPKSCKSGRNGQLSGERQLWSM